MAAKPPPNKSAMATKPSIKAQKMRWPTGAFNFPPEVILSMTNEPLSEEVTKNTETIKIPMILVKVYKGNAFKKMNKEVEVSSKTGIDKIPGVSISSNSPDPPKTLIQKKVIKVGTNNTPKTNSLNVRPFEILAMNIPTKGAHATHQA